MDAESTRPAKKQRLNPTEVDCMREISCFVEFGGYALDLLPKVIENIWKHYGIDDEAQRHRILRASGAYMSLTHHNANK